ncbi:hypothetical protein SELMODRAFT_420196 [Selaginella moellendorffii]|uniref:Uncharacterized protein n=1 Tax=Selaginella moellendorffii TaxID=88036 RepID=D8SB91_SELML|nr:hypothetical protein SELMODRAFT_420196 [Selaginella moellendorffii]
MYTRMITMYENKYVKLFCYRGHRKFSTSITHFYHDMINLQYEHIFCGNKTRDRPQYCLLDCTIGHQRYGRERRLRLCFPFVLGFPASLLQYHNVLLSTLLVMKKRRKEAPVSLQDDILETLLSYVDLATLLVVGNPVTQEWSELPPLHWEDRERYSLAGVIDFAMFVNKNGFKVGLPYTAVDFSGHWCCIYDSVTRSSSLPKLPFSPAYVKVKAQQRLSDYIVNVVFPGLDDYFYDAAILGFYDFGRARWSTGEVVRSLLEDKVDPDGEILRCVLPLPGLCTARLWEYNGQRVAGCMRS